MLQRPTLPPRQVESEGILRILLLAFSVAMPLASMIYLQVQKSRLGYEMSDIRKKIHEAEELQRKLLLEHSRHQRDEEIQAYAQKVGLQPRKQGHVIHRRFTADDQRLAKLRPVSSDSL